MKQVAPPLPASAPASLVCAMTPAEIGLLAGSLRSAKTYLEFGAGGSTLLATDLVAGPITSVDSSAEWLARLNAHVGETSAAGRVHLHWVDIGPVDALGYPTDPGRRSGWPRYHAAVWDHMPPEAVDLVLIDGRFRVACFLQAVRRCRPDVLILVHDFAPRPAYARMADFGREVCRVERLSAFVPRTRLDVDRLDSAIERSAHNPH